MYHIYYQFLLTKTPSMVTFIYDNLVFFFFIAVNQKTDSNCPSPIFFPSFFLPHFDTILHIAVISIFI